MNGKPSSNMTLSEINTMLRTGPGSRINIELIRNNEVIKNSFRLKRMI
jgi:C-terminal processing protease CtpA/Prc